MTAEFKRNLKSRFENILSIVSVFFVVFLFLNVDWKRISLEFDYLSILFSLALCVFGFLFQGLSWKYVLSAFGIDVSMRMAISSISKTIFSKYVPGKVWMLLGRANYISVRLDLPLKSITKASIFGQVISLVFAFVTLALWSFNFDFAQYNDLFIKFIFLAFSIVALFAILRFFTVPEARLAVTLKIAFCCVGMWLSWGFGFAVLCLGTSIVIPIQFDALPFIFVLASVVGILAFIFPGGLGVREGGIIGLLTLWNVPLQDAITLAILARVWFLAAESIFFLIFSIKQA